MLAAAVACGGGGGEPGVPEAPDTVTLTSSSFEDGGEIPRPLTCDGDDRSPSLGWQGLPEGTREVALLMEDPDAPRGTFVHWVVWGLDPGIQIDAGRLPEGAKAGRNGFGRGGYGGPCPPKGDDPHRYVFTVLALSEPLRLDPGASAGDLKEAVADTVLARGRLTGRYGRRAVGRF